MNGNPRTWITEFGAEAGVPPEIDRLVAAGTLIDESWHNDVSPSFRIARTGEAGAGEAMILWIEHPEPDKRECGGKRFSFRCNGNDKFDLETDSLDEALAYERAVL